MVNKNKLRGYYAEFNQFDKNGKLISKELFDYSELKEMIFAGEIESYVVDEIGIKVVKK